jgi:hypothetical protein
MSLGNIPTWRCNKQDAKYLLGYLPIIKSSSGIDKSTIRQTFHKCLEIILEPIRTLSESGIDLLFGDKYIWFFPKISTIIVDWPEAATFCLTYKSTNSKCPCHFCLIDKDDLANLKFSKNKLEFRTYQNMQNYFENDEEKLVCIESVQNYFWRFT